MASTPDIGLSYFEACMMIVGMIGIFATIHVMLRQNMKDDLDRAYKKIIGKDEEIRALTRDLDRIGKERDEFERRVRELEG